MNFDLFNNNPVKTTVAYSLAIVGVTCAAFKFIYKDNELDFKQAQIESVKQQVEQYKAKLEITEKERDNLDKMNKQYLDWLQSTPQTLPFYEKKIKELEKNTQCNCNQNSIIENIPDTEKNVHDTITSGSYSHTESIKKGYTFIDEKIPVSLSIGDIHYTPLSISGTINLPFNKSEIFEKKGPGTIWNFKFHNKDFLIMIESINWYFDSCEITVKEVPH